METPVGAKNISWLAEQSDEPRGGDIEHALQSSLAGRYEIIRELGAGGMATVYLARDVRHQREVALKVLRGTSDADSAERFHREIAISGTLQHPHILPVFDSGDAGGLLWFTMPFVAGGSLRDRMRREGRMALDEAMRITREIALALDYAHRKGVVHRDIKPDNILMSDDQALLSDFGIGRISSDDGQTLLTVTQAGLMMGTVAYMSPEQTSGATDLDGRTDIYSLASVLYEMLAGERPCEGTTAHAVIAKRMSGVIPPLRQIRPDAPEGVEQTVTKALALDRKDRHATAAEFAKALTEPARSQTKVARVPDGPPSGSRRIVLGTLIAGTAGAIAGGAVWWKHLSNGSSATGAIRIAVLPFENTGSPDDAHFVDGVTDAIRAKLSEMPLMEVIARESSIAYRRTTKTAKDIAQELAVAFLLRGTIRFDKSGGKTRVQVNPELVQASTVTTKWTRAFDDVLTDVFKVQADIAGQVASALGVALGASEHRTLGYVPTSKVDAYEELLKGDQAQDWPLNDANPVKVKAALPHYLEAVKLDPEFATAHARLSILYSLMVAAGGASPEVADAALQAAKRATALAPDRLDTRFAMAFYNRWVLSDNTKALQELAKIPEQVGANDELYLRSKAAAQISLGHEDDGFSLLRRARKLNPLSPGVVRVLGKWLTWARHYPEALEVNDRTLKLDPKIFEAYSWKVVSRLAVGDVAGAREIWRTAVNQLPARVLPGALRINAAPIELAWMLDDAQGARWVEAMKAASYPSLLVAQDLTNYYWLRGDRDRARPHIDAARATLEQSVKTPPSIAINHAQLGLMYAYLDRRQEAIGEGLRAAELLTIRQDNYQGVFIQKTLSDIYISTSEPEKALDVIEPLLRISGYLTPAWLRIDPTYAPLKGNPRFERLIAKA